MDEEKRKLEEEKLRQEKERKEAEEKLRQEKEKREKEEKLRQEKERKEAEEKLRQEKEFKAISVANSEKIYNKRNRNNNKELSEKITIRDSELDNEELMINDSSNISKIDVINNKNKNNFIMGNNNYRNMAEKNGMKIAGVSPDNRLVEIVEIKDNPWAVGVQFHPELKSRPNHAHPLFADFVQAVKNNKK